MTEYEVRLNTKTGQRSVQKSLTNFRTLICMKAVTLRHNLFNGRDEIGGDLFREMYGIEGTVGEIALVFLRELVEAEWTCTVSNELIEQWTKAEAWLNRYHPVREWLDSLKWDGTPRLATLFLRYAGAEDTALHRAIAGVFCVAAVRRIRNPGSKFDEVIVAEGPQGTLKSTFWCTLAVRKDWFSDSLDLRTAARVEQKLIEQTKGKWLVELPELAGLRSDVLENVKGMLSRDTDRSRLSYGRGTAQEFPREFILVGSTNNEQYLDDEQNRRVWPIKFGKVDVRALEADREQIWAEAAQLEAANAPSRLPEEFYADATRAQDDRRTDNVCTPYVERFVDAARKDGFADFWTPAATDNLARLLPLDSQELDRLKRTLKDLKRALRDAGFRDGRKVHPETNKQTRAWIMGDADRAEFIPCARSTNPPATTKGRKKKK